MWTVQVSNAKDGRWLNTRRVVDKEKAIAVYVRRVFEMPEYRWRVVDSDGNDLINGE